MRITDAFVDDPTLDGKLLRPILVVGVDEMPDVTIEPESFAGGWTVGKYGPFVKYSGPDNPNAGDFNVRFRNRFPVIVDIVLQVAGTSDYPGFSLPLTRARQLVRKHDRDWRLLISDSAAEQGSLLWVPVQTNPVCRWYMRTEVCGQRPAKSIRVNEVDLPLCEEHIKEHNERFAAKRRAQTTAS